MQQRGSSTPKVIGNSARPKMQRRGGYRYQTAEFTPLPIPG
jgi:hypothetical protein